jgi:lipopolysaccharide transport system ATP-binding protein
LKPILEIQNIGKKYRIEQEKQPYLSLRDSIAGIFKPSAGKEDFWALKDVSFQVMPGDTVGIIGKNGAGKSTLLKILSKITPPTAGKIISRGRIASLLEVGTGFHPELNGKENIFLNGSILGMKRSEIQKQFDAIVNFSGVEKFINTPLKHYSSGMQLRLAFAVAAFLEPEILIIDEVLAVGDAEFQKKCLSKMEDVSRSGRTILFVSHQMSAIKNLCRKGVFLKNGELQSFDAIDPVINSYLKTSEQELTVNTAVEDKTNGFIFKLANDQNKNSFNFNEEIHFHFETLRPDTDHLLRLGFSLKDRYEKRVFIDFFEFKTSNSKNLKVDFKIPAGFLTPGKYFIDISLQTNYEQFWLKNDALFFEVDLLSTQYESLNYDYGMVSSAISWEEK